MANKTTNNRTEPGNSQNEGNAADAIPAAIELDQKPAEDVFSHILLDGLESSTGQAPQAESIQPIATEEARPHALLSARAESIPSAVLLPQRIPLVLSILLTALFAYTTGYWSSAIPSMRANTQNSPAETKTDPFANISLEAKAVYVYDVIGKKVLFAFNEHTVLPLASLTKIMTAFTASQMLPSGTVVTIGKQDIEQEGDSGLLSGEHWRLTDLLNYTLTNSSNDGASAIAAAAGSTGQNAYGMSEDESKQEFIDQMNRNALTLGLPGMHFFNPTGLDMNEEVSGGYGTAYDVAILMSHALETIYPDMESTSRARISITSLDNLRHISTNTNEKIGAIPAVIASKTGYTDLAGGNLVVAFDAGMMHPIIVVALGSTREGRFSDVEKLSWAALQALR